MAESSAYRLVPDCKVSLEGKRIGNDLDARLTRVDIDLDVEAFGQCVLTFNDPKLALINGTDFACGKLISIEIGFHTRLQKVFQGEVVALEPQFRRDVPPALKVVCAESIHRLALSQNTRSFNDVDDNDIVRLIAQDIGLTSEAPSGTKEHVLQGNLTDAAFLRKLAAKNGNTVRIEGKKLIVGPPPKGEDVEIAPGDGLRKIKVQLTSAAQVGEITVHGWDPKTKKEITGKAKPEGESGKVAKDHGKGTLSVASHHPPADVGTAEAMAKGRLRKLAESGVQAQGEMVGDPGVVPGAVLNLAKIGEKIDGRYRVDRATHAFSKHGYLVKFRAVKIGPKKPPPQHKGKGGTDGKGGDGDHRGDHGGKDRQKRKLRDLKFGYQGGKSVDKTVDAEWRRIEKGIVLKDLHFGYQPGRGGAGDHDPKFADLHGAVHLADLKFGYRRGSFDAADRDPDFTDTPPVALEDLRFRYSRHHGPVQDDSDDQKRPEELPNLQSLRLGYEE